MGRVVTENKRFGRTVMTVKIHGKDYKTVAERLNDFRADHPDWGIITERKPTVDDYVEVYVEIRNESGFIIGTGMAEEVRGSTQINKTSALENCETSAIGRALAACGYAGTEYASANEVQNAIQQQSEVTPDEVTKRTEQAIAGLDNAYDVSLNEKDVKAIQTEWRKVSRLFSIDFIPIPAKVEAHKNKLKEKLIEKLGEST